jgi:DNA repair protein RadC
MNTVTTVTPIYSAEPLYVRDGSGFREARTPEIIARADALILERYRRGEPVLDRPSRTSAFLRIHVGSRDYQVFGILHLDADDRLIEAEDLFRGTLDFTSVHPREVMKSVLSHQSTSVIFYQNYPASASDPKESDIRGAQRLTIALGLMDVPVRDHLIVGKKIFSLAAKGLI